MRAEKETSEQGGNVKLNSCWHPGGPQSDIAPIRDLEGVELSSRKGMMRWVERHRYHFIDSVRS
jgi:hypothetical protein